jgi:cystathionine beta-lyase
VVQRSYVTTAQAVLPDTWAAYDALQPDDLRLRGAMKWSAHPDDVLNAWIAEMDFGTAPAVTEALTRFAVDGSSLGYATPAQLQAVSEACARWQLRDFGASFDPEMIVPVGDVIKAFEITIGLFSRPGSAVVVPTPAYLSFLQVPAMFGRQVIKVPMVRDSAADGGRGRWVLDLDAVEAAFRSGAGVFTLCNPQNPLGVVHSVDELTAVARLADRYGVRVFADEVHAPFVFDSHRHVPYASISATAEAHTITATSASKGWNLQGLKCAQLIITNADDADTLRPVRLPQTLTAGVPGLVATVAAYLDGGEWLADVVGYLARNRRHLVDLMATHAPDLVWDVPEGTYMTLLDCSSLGLPAGMNATDFFLEHARVSLNNGEKFGTGPHHVRFNFATPLPILHQMIARLGRAIDHRYQGAR